MEKEQHRGRESERERRKRERERDRDGVWLEKGCDIGYNLDCWSSLQGLREGIFLGVGLSAYQDGN